MHQFGARVSDHTPGNGTLPDKGVLSSRPGIIDNGRHQLSIDDSTIQDYQDWYLSRNGVSNVEWIKVCWDGTV